MGHLIFCELQLKIRKTHFRMFLRKDPQYHYTLVLALAGYSWRIFHKMDPSCKSTSNENSIQAYQLNYSTQNHRVDLANLKLYLLSHYHCHRLLLPLVFLFCCFMVLAL